MKDFVEGRKNIAMFTVQIVICVLFLLFVAFWVGRRIGQMRVFKLEKMLEEASASAEHIIRSMNEVVDKHQESMGSRTESLKELLLVTDKKADYVNELLEELELLRDEIKNRTLEEGAGLTDTAQKNRERRFKREMEQALKEGLGSTHGLIDEMQSRIRQLEKENSRLAEDLKHELEGSLRAKSLSKDDVREIIATELGVYLSFLEPGAGQGDINAQVDADILSMKQHDEAVTKSGYSFEPVAVQNDFPSASPKAQATDFSMLDEPTLEGLIEHPRKAGSQRQRAYKVPSEPGTLDRSSYIPQAPLSKPVSLDEQRMLERLSAKQEIPSHAMQVLELYEQGVVLPQIAQKLRIGVGEADLLLRLYSQNKTMDWED